MAITQIDKVLYTAKAHTTGGREGGTSRTSDGELDVKLAVPGTHAKGTNPEQLFAVGWSAYLVGWLQSAGLELPHALLAGPHAGGIVNLPAVLVALAIAGLLVAGTRESATLNIILVIIKMTALAAFGAQKGQPFRDPRVFRSAVELTSITATVRDQDGRLVTGLTRDAFEVVPKPADNDGSR